MIWRFIRLLERLGLAPALPASAVEAWEAALAQSQTEERGRIVPETLPGTRVLLTDTPIYQQLAPDSPVLAELNRPGTLPAQIEAHTFYGDIRAAVRITAGGLKLVDETVSFGDMAVPAHSAREIPGAQCHGAPLCEREAAGDDAAAAAAGSGAVAGRAPARRCARQAVNQSRRA